MNDDYKWACANIHHTEPPVEEESLFETTCYCSLDTLPLCGKGCLHRQMFVECTFGKCPSKFGCTNNVIQRKLWKKVVVNDAEEKGQGLFAGETIPAKSFIIEYIGEVIDNDEFQNRMKKRSDSEHHYFMQLDTKNIIDATKVGNEARFINHSCNPNAEFQKWWISSQDRRICVFAIEEIGDGDEITVNYNWDSFGEFKQACKCGSVGCSGFIGVPVSKK